MGCKGKTPPSFYSSYSSWPNFQRCILFLFNGWETVELIMAVLQILEESVTIMKWILCKKCRIETLKWFIIFNPCAGCGSSLQYTAPGCDLLYLSKLLVTDCPQCHSLDTTASLLHVLKSFSFFFFFWVVLSESSTFDFLQYVPNKHVLLFQ